MFTLEWKYSFDFYYEIACLMIERNIKSIPQMKERIGLFSSPLIIYPDLFINHPGILKGAILTESRMLIIRRKYIEDIISADVNSFKYVTRQFMCMQIIICVILNQMTLSGELIREWFVDTTDQNDWLSVFKEYNVFQSFVLENCGIRRKQDM